VGGNKARNDLRRRVSCDGCEEKGPGRLLVKYLWVVKASRREGLRDGLRVRMG